MEINGDGRPAIGGSVLEATMTVPISGGAKIAGIAVAILAVFFSPYDPIYAAVGVLLIGIPLWLAIVRMNQRYIEDRAAEVIALVSTTLEDGLGGPGHVTLSDAD
jgi:hypothetical protein